MGCAHGLDTMEPTLAEVPSSCDVYTNNGANIGRSYKNFEVRSIDECCTQCWGQCTHFDLDGTKKGKLTCYLISGPVAWETTVGHSVGMKSSDRQASLDELLEVDRRNLTLRGEPDISEVVNALATGWNFVRDNQGTATVDASTSANAVPKNVDFYKLGGFKYFSLGSRAHPLSMVFKSKAGFEVGRIEFGIEWAAKGTYKNKGNFISDLHLKYFYIKPGFDNHLNCDVTVGSPTNIGSVKDPLAAIRLTLSFKDNNAQYSQEFLVKGDGTIQQMGLDEVVV